MVYDYRAKAYARPYADGVFRAGRADKDFNPDQPRDEHGRWTSGGAGGGTATVTSNRPALVDQMRENAARVAANMALAADFERKWGVPVKGFSTDLLGNEAGNGVPTENVKTALDALDKLSTDYPDVTKSISEVKFEDAGNKGVLAYVRPLAFSSEPDKHSMMVINSANPVVNPRTGFSVAEQERLIREEHMTPEAVRTSGETLFKARMAQGWFVQSDAPALKYVLTHEYGHAVANYMTQTSADNRRVYYDVANRFENQLRVLREDMADVGRPEAVVERALGQRALVSEYSAMNPDEEWAESFAAHKLNPTRYGDYGSVKLVQDALKKTKLE